MGFVVFIVIGIVLFFSGMYVSEEMKKEDEGLMLGGIGVMSFLGGMFYWFIVSVTPTVEHF